MNIFRNSCACSFLFIFLSSYSQDGNIKFDHIGTRDGLSQSNVICILQDRRGFMWFGTRDGLNKYDGYKFTVYKNDPENINTPSHAAILDITEDTEGNLWIITGGGGLDKFDISNEKFSHFPASPTSIADNYNNCMLLDTEGNLWIGGEGSGLNMYDTKKKTFEHYVHAEGDPTSLGNNRVRDIFEDSRHNLWFCTDSGLNLFNKKSKTFKRFQHDPNNPKSLSHDRVWAILEDDNKQLWVGTNGGGLNQFNPATEGFRHFRHDPAQRNSLPIDAIRTMANDGRGNLWICTENGGLGIFNIQTETFDNYHQDSMDKESLSDNSFWSVFKDAKGNMWIGSFSSGINFVNRDAIDRFVHFRHTSSPSSLSDNKVLCILEDSRENLWIGTDGGGLNLQRPKTSGFHHFIHDNTKKNSICGNHVLSLEEDFENNIWVGTWGDGITVINPDKNTFRHFTFDPADSTSLNSPNVWTLFEDSERNMWIGTYSEGLNLYDRKKNRFIHFKNDPSRPASLRNNSVNIIFEDSRKNLWVGVNGGGLELFDKKTNGFKHFMHKDSLNSISNNDILCIAEDHHGNLWIGTTSGLSRLDTKTYQFTNYFIKDGLPNNTVIGILFDNSGELWLATYNGLSRFSPGTNKFKNFGVNDGLQGYEFKKGAWKARSGKMYFGGINGFNGFYPDSIKDLQYDPPLVLTDFLIFNKHVPIDTTENNSSALKQNITATKEINLSYDQSVISFEFASLNYTSDKEKRKYAYILEGFDNDWNNIGTNRQATYTNLDHGNYTFRVRGLNNEGTWSGQTVSLGLHITPPFWQTWWFRIVSASLAVGGLVAFLRIRLNSIQNQRRELERQVKDRTELLALSIEEERKARQDAEYANRAKTVFLATMSHEIRTPMNGVIGMASLLEETKLTPEQADYTENIRNSGETLLGVINDILDFSKIESGKMELEQQDFDLRDSMEEVLDVFAAKASAAGLDLIYQLDADVPEQIIGDSLRLRQVLMNLVGNAVKFTHQGEIFIHARLTMKDCDNLVLGFEVKDTGIGIPKDKLSQMFNAFTQVDSSTTRKYGGSGLGLAISEKLVNLMGGKISVDSTLGQGTTFRFTIQTTISIAPLPINMPYNMSGLEGKRILVVDDNSTNCTILKSQLEGWKLTAVVTNSGKQALQLLSDGPGFDLVLTDMNMPEMDGLHLGQAIKSAYPTLPIVLISSIGDQRRKGSAEIFSSVLTKPVKQNMLCKVILIALHKQGNVTLPEDDVKLKLPADFSGKHPLRILVAEDNAINQKLTERVLNKLGYQIKIASNGLEVLEAINGKVYDLIFMDVQMPEIDGLEATRQIRRRSGKQPVIIAMTANVMKEDRDLCLQAGMDDYLGKPIKLDRLVNTLEKWSTYLSKQPP